MEVNPLFENPCSQAKSRATFPSVLFPPRRRGSECCWMYFSSIPLVLPTKDSLCVENFPLVFVQNFLLVRALDQSCLPLLPLDLRVAATSPSPLPRSRTHSSGVSFLDVFLAISCRQVFLDVFLLSRLISRRLPCPPERISRFHPHY